MTTESANALGYLIGIVLVVLVLSYDPLATNWHLDYPDDEPDPNGDDRKTPDEG